MSLDEQKELALYKALIDVLREPRPAWRERVMRETVEGIMRRMRWQQVSLPDLSAPAQLIKQEPKP